jgi:hypothetical protein
VADESITAREDLIINLGMVHREEEWRGAELISKYC